MISSRALLKRVAGSLVVLSGLGMAPAARAYPFQRQIEAHRAHKIGKGFARVLGYHGGTQAKVQGNAIDLIPSAFGGRMPRGLHMDKDLARPLTVEIDTDLSPLSFTNLAQNTKGGQTDAEAEYLKSYGPILGPDYLHQESQAFRPPILETKLYPLDSAEAIRRDVSQEFHEALHGFYARQQAMLDLLEGRDRPADLGDSKVWGHGPKLNRLLTSQETPEETATRQKHLQSFSKGTGDDADYVEYGVFDNELHSYLGQMIAQAIYSGKWKRLPENKGELWAATENAIGRQKAPMFNASGASLFADVLNGAVDAPRFAPDGDNEVTRFLASPAGKKALKEFPPVPFSGAAYQLCMGLDRLKGENRAKFYIEVLPEIYGEILEELRDGKGMAKMGLPSDPNYALSFTDHLMHLQDRGGWQWSDRTWKRVAGKVEPEVFKNVAAESIAHPKPVALEALLDAADRRNLLTAGEKSELLEGALDAARRATGPDKAAVEREVLLLEKHGAVLP